jgi:hypothetical protein
MSDLAPALKSSPVSTPEHYVFDGVIGPDELVWIYHKLLSTRSWTLLKSSKPVTAAGFLPFMHYPGLLIERRGEIYSEFLSGYFRGVIFRVRERVKKLDGTTLPPDIRRIHVVAKSSLSKTEFHADMKDQRAWSIVGFLNPVWNAADGGEFFLENHKIEYRSGRFIVFPSHIQHDGGFVKNEKLNYWRVAVNIILHHGDPGAGLDETP